MLCICGAKQRELVAHQASSRDKATCGSLSCPVALELLLLLLLRRSHSHALAAACQPAPTEQTASAPRESALPSGGRRKTPPRGPAGHGSVQQSTLGRTCTMWTRAAPSGGPKLRSVLRLWARAIGDAGVARPVAPRPARSAGVTQQSESHPRTHCCPCQACGAGARWRSECWLELAGRPVVAPEPAGGALQPRHRVSKH